ncbi:MAG: DUF3445 domain-containing protein, partial [Aquisalinus sp.]|nr:DUF3445 domain-containing protein [Aquisalinus sp.]
MTLFRYTPYDGSTHPFTMGLQLCDPENWIEIDETFTEQLTQKNDLLDQQPEAVYQRTSGSLKAEGEVLDMLLDYLPKRFPEIYAYKDGIISVKPQTKSFRVCDFSETPLKLAGQLVQEDFCIIQPTDRSHKLTAACLCFPS